MLIEFSVSNYWSFRERQTLSLVAATRDSKLPDNVLDKKLPGLAKTRFLKTAAVYGANASGKTNLWRAAMFMRDFVTGSASGTNEGDPIDTIPFLLGKGESERPSEFEVIFEHEGTRYQYGFSVDKERVHEEWLNAYPEGRAQRWFHRSLADNGHDYKWRFSPTNFRGDRGGLKEKTRTNALFLSTAAQFNHEQLRIVYIWFSRYFHGIGNVAGLTLSPLSGITELMLVKEKVNAEAVMGLLRQADLGILRVEVEQREVGPSDFPPDMPADIRRKLLGELEKALITKSRWFHERTGTGKDVEFTGEQESAGTRKFFALIGPWLEALRSGYTVFIDEIGANMHPLLVRQLIRMFHDPEVNSKGAQLVLTTHDTTLLDMSLFRRDQIWFTEKDEVGGTVLFPLTDFKPRDNEALQKGYLAGRYGGIPFFEGELTF